MPARRSSFFPACIARASRQSEQPWTSWLADSPPCREIMSEDDLHYRSNCSKNVLAGWFFTFAGGGCLCARIYYGLPHRSFLHCCLLPSTRALGAGTIILRRRIEAIFIDFVVVLALRLRLEVVAAPRAVGARVYDVLVIAYDTEDISIVRNGADNVLRSRSAGSGVFVGRGRSTFVVVVGGGLLPSRSFASSSSSSSSSILAAF